MPEFEQDMAVVCEDSRYVSPTLHRVATNAVLEPGDIEQETHQGLHMKYTRIVAVICTQHELHRLPPTELSYTLHTNYPIGPCATAFYTDIISWNLDAMKLMSVSLYLQNNSSHMSSLIYTKVWSPVHCLF